MLLIFITSSADFVSFLTLEGVEKTSLATEAVRHLHQLQVFAHLPMKPT